MKKHAGKIALYSLVALLGLASCSKESIFASIESEIKMKDPSVKGTVTNLAEYGGSIYAANGRLMRKVGSSRSWIQTALPAGVFRCTEVASSGTAGALFAIFQDAKWSFHSLQRFDGSSWSVVATAVPVVGIRNGAGSIFAFLEDSADYSAGNINATYSVVTVSSAGAVSAPIVAGTPSRPMAASGTVVATSTAVYDGGVLVPAGADGPAAGIRGVAQDGGTIWAVTNAYAYRYDGAWIRFPHNVALPVTSFAWLKTPSKNVLLISGNEGYGEIVLDPADNPLLFQWPGYTTTSSIGVEARKEYQTNLEDYNTSLIAVFTDANVLPAGDEYALYLGVVDKEYDGLWGYYPLTQRIWNRE